MTLCSGSLKKRSSPYQQSLRDTMQRELQHVHGKATKNSSVVKHCSQICSLSFNSDAKLRSECHSFVRTYSFCFSIRTQIGESAKQASDNCFNQLEQVEYEEKSEVDSLMCAKTVAPFFAVYRKSDICDSFQKRYEKWITNEIFTTNDRMDSVNSGDVKQRYLKELQALSLMKLELKHDYSTANDQTQDLLQLLENLSHKVASLPQECVQALLHLEGEILDFYEISQEITLQVDKSSSKPQDIQTTVSLYQRILPALTAATGNFTSNLKQAKKLLKSLEVSGKETKSFLVEKETDFIITPEVFSGYLKKLSIIDHQMENFFLDFGVMLERVTQEVTISIQQFEKGTNDREAWNEWLNQQLQIITMYA
mmetsp:Transcript_3857/g.4227  ORF Transcript_3857/g.4227 Transcript_3857/m.4227 type:complete len:367 (+) Transcript_3857:117-1217(+)